MNSLAEVIASAPRNDDGDSTASVSSFQQDEDEFESSSRPSRMRESASDVDESASHGEMETAVSDQREDTASPCAEAADVACLGAPTTASSVGAPSTTSAASPKRPIAASSPSPTESLVSSASDLLAHLPSRPRPSSVTPTRLFRPVKVASDDEQPSLQKSKPQAEEEEECFLCRNRSGVARLHVLDSRTRRVDPKALTRAIEILSNPKRVKEAELVVTLRALERLKKYAHDLWPNRPLRGLVPADDDAVNAEDLRVSQSTQTMLRDAQRLMSVGSTTSTSSAPLSGTAPTLAPERKGTSSVNFFAKLRMRKDIMLKGISSRSLSADSETKCESEADAVNSKPTFMDERETLRRTLLARGESRLLEVNKFLRQPKLVSEEVPNARASSASPSDDGKTLSAPASQEVQDEAAKSQSDEDASSEEEEEEEESDASSDAEDDEDVVLEEKEGEGELEGSQGEEEETEEALQMRMAEIEKEELVVVEVEKTSLLSVVDVAPRRGDDDVSIKEESTEDKETTSADESEEGDVEDEEDDDEVSNSAYAEMLAKDAKTHERLKQQANLLSGEAEEGEEDDDDDELGRPTPTKPKKILERDDYEDDERDFVPTSDDLEAIVDRVKEAVNPEKVIEKFREQEEKADAEELKRIQRDAKNHTFLKNRKRNRLAMSARARHAGAALDDDSSSSEEEDEEIAMAHEERYQASLRARLEEIRRAQNPAEELGETEEDLMEEKAQAAKFLANVMTHKLRWRKKAKMSQESYEEHDMSSQRSSLSVSRGLPTPPPSQFGSFSQDYENNANWGVEFTTSSTSLSVSATTTTTLSGKPNGGLIKRSASLLAPMAPGNHSNLGLFGGPNNSNTGRASAPPADGNLSNAGTDVVRVRPKQFVFKVVENEPKQPLSTLATANTTETPRKRIKPILLAESKTLPAAIPSTAQREVARTASLMTARMGAFLKIQPKTNMTTRR